jgi:hypothetical protein
VREEDDQEQKVEDLVFYVIEASGGGCSEPSYVNLL